MSIQKALILTAALASAGFAHATVNTNTSGLTTTWTENFDNGTSFVLTGNDADIINAGSDDYLRLGNRGTATYTFSSAQNLSSLSLSFWYSTADTSNGAGTFLTSMINLPDSTLSNNNNNSWNNTNPGPNSQSTGDALFSTSLTNVAAGTYTLSFSTDNNPNLQNIKIDNVVITATAVPEPETYAMMLAGLGALGFMGHRRKLGK